MHYCHVKNLLCSSFLMALCTISSATGMQEAAVVATNQTTSTVDTSIFAEILARANFENLVDHMIVAQQRVNALRSFLRQFLADRNLWTEENIRYIEGAATILGKLKNSIIEFSGRPRVYTQDPDGIITEINDTQKKAHMALLLCGWVKTDSPSKTFN